MGRQAGWVVLLAVAVVDTCKRCVGRAKTSSQRRLDDSVPDAKVNATWVWGDGTRCKFWRAREKTVLIRGRLRHPSSGVCRGILGRTGAMAQCQLRRTGASLDSALSAWCAITGICL